MRSDQLRAKKNSNALYKKESHPENAEMFIPLYTIKVIFIYQKNNFPGGGGIAVGCVFGGWGHSGVKRSPLEEILGKAIVVMWGRPRPWATGGAL